MNNVGNKKTYSQKETDLSVFFTRKETQEVKKIIQKKEEEIPEKIEVIPPQKELIEVNNITHVTPSGAKESFPSREKAHNKNIVLISAVSLILVLLVAISLYYIVAPSPALSLTEEKITIKYGSSVNLKDYAIYDDNATLEISPVDLKKVGDQEVVYTLTRGLKKSNKSLILTIIDDVPPEFSLIQNEIEIKREDVNSFNCLDYVDISSIIDNADGKYLDNGKTNLSISCPSIEAYKDKTNIIIKYELTDSSGNSTVKPY